MSVGRGLGPHRHDPRAQSCKTFPTPPAPHCEVNERVCRTVYQSLLQPKSSYGWLVRQAKTQPASQGTCAAYSYLLMSHCAQHCPKQNGKHGPHPVELGVWPCSLDSCKTPSWGQGEVSLCEDCGIGLQVISGKEAMATNMKQRSLYQYPWRCIAGMCAFVWLFNKIPVHTMCVQIRVLGV